MKYAKAPIDADDTPSTDLFVDKVIDFTACDRHDAKEGYPCFWATAYTSDNTIQGICNTRALRAGYNGYINPRSLTRSFKPASV